MESLAANGTVTSVDALVLCGDRGASKPVNDESKAFLFLQGKPLFIHVVEALERVDRIRRIFIVGDMRRLDLYLNKRRHKESSGRPKEIVTLEQGNSLLSNVWDGFLFTIDGYEPGLEQSDSRIKDKVIFVLPGDSPLVTPGEINEFMDRSDMANNDMLSGITPAAVMKRFHPKGDRPGIVMSSMYVREGAFRVSNMHMARPFACKNRIVIQQMYNSRYQKDLGNIVRLTKNMWEHHVKLHSLAIYILMQISLFLAFLRLGRLNYLSRRYTPLSSVSASVSRILGLRFGCVITEGGGAALDIDNVHDYEAMKQRFFEWKKELA